MNIRRRRCCAPSASPSPTAFRPLRPRKRSRPPRSSAGRSGWSRARFTPAVAARASSRSLPPVTRGRAARPLDRGSGSLRPADAGRDSGHRADRAGRQAGQPPLYRGRGEYRQGVLSLGAGRPPDEPGVVCHFDRGRRQHRGRGGSLAREDPYVFRRSGDRHHAASRPHRGARARTDGRSRQADRDSRGASLRRLPQ